MQFTVGWLYLNKAVEESHIHLVMIYIYEFDKLCGN